jgi:hypothetical protein
VQFQQVQQAHALDDAARASDLEIQQTQTGHCQQIEAPRSYAADHLPSPEKFPNTKLHVRATSDKMSQRKILEISLADWDNRKQEIAAQLFEAAKDTGFFYISGECTIGFRVLAGAVLHSRHRGARAAGVCRLGMPPGHAPGSAPWPAPRSKQ